MPEKYNMANRIFCIIPAYNEENNIGLVVDQVLPFVENIVVVDDGSSDRTGMIAKSKKAIVVTHLLNRGQGAALQTGTELSIKMGADILVHFDADGQFLANEIPEIVFPIASNGFQAVIGSRFLEKKSKLPALKRYFIFPLARIFNRIFYKLNYTDPQCGFRALSREAAKLIKIEQDGMAHCSEILIKIDRNKLKVKEVAVSVRYIGFGQNLSGGLNIIKDLFLSKLLK